MPIPHELRAELESLIEESLMPVLANCYSYRFSRQDDTIELLVKEKEDSPSSRLIVRLFFPAGSPQVHIPNFQFPDEWRGSRLGLRMVRGLFELCENYQCPLFFTNMTESFFRYMLSHGAACIDEDTVEILPETRLI